MTKRAKILATSVVPYSKPSQTSKMELFAKIVNVFQPLSVFAKKIQLRSFTEFCIRLCSAIRLLVTRVLKNDVFKL